MNSKSAYPLQLRRHLYSAFIGDLALPIFYTFLPLLAVKLGADALEIGLVGGSNYAVYTFMPFIMGRFTDKTKSNRFFITAAFSILATVSFLYSVVPNPAALIAARIFEGIGWAILWPAIQSGVAQTDTLSSKFALSVYNFTWSGAAAIAPIVGAVLVTVFSIQFAFQITAFALVSAIIVNIIPSFSQRITGQTNSVGEEKSAAGPPKLTAEGMSQNRKALVQLRKKDQTGSEISHDYGHHNNWLYVLALASAAISNAVLLTFFPPFAESVGLSVLLVGLIVFVYGIVRFGLYFLLTRESVMMKVYEPSGRNKRILIALATVSISNLLFALLDRNIALYFVLFAFGGAAYSLNNTICQVILVAEAPRERFGTGAGTYESSVGIGAFLGPIIAGMISQGSLVKPFLVPVLCYLPVLAIFVSLSKLKSIQV